MFIKQSLSSDYYDIGLNLLEQNSIKPTSQEILIKSLILNTPKFDAVMKEKSLKQISSSTIALKKVHKQEYLQLLKSLVTTLNGEERFGVEYYKKDIDIFTKSDKVAFCNDLLTWLDSQPNLSMGHFASLEIITLSWDIISLTNREKIIHILFDEYLTKATDVSEIVKAGDLIQQINPKYKDYEPHFEQVKYKFERETQSPLKKAIIQQINKISPRRTNKKNNEFWTFIKNEFSKDN